MNGIPPSEIRKYLHPQGSLVGANTNLCALLLPEDYDFVNNLTRATQNADPIIAIGFFVDTPLDQVA